jgi:hypothetical protein
MENLARDKRSSLFFPAVGNEEKSFIQLRPDAIVFDAAFEA